jgi:ketosteroid isomerase-like protein
LILEPSEIKKTIRGIIEAFNVRDISTMASFYTDDVTYIRSEGTFRGKEEVKRYYAWALSNWETTKIVEKNIIVEGDKAALEYMQEGTSLRRKGKKLNCYSIVTFTFKEGKVKEIHFCQDRLLVAKQLASGWLENTIVNSVISHMEKGLH